MPPSRLLTLAFALAAAAGLHGQPLTDAKVTELRAQIRANFFIPEPLPSLDAKTHRRFAPAAGVKAEAVTYTTQLGSRVPAILYLPDPLPRGKIPAFIVVNGHGGDKYAWYAYFTGVSYARGGAAVLTYDQAGEGERSGNRTSGTREHDKLVGDATMARRLEGLMLTDVMQAVSYLRSRPEVDAARIGAAGYSLGSFVLSIAGAIEPRLHACVLVGGGNLDGPGGYWDRAKQMCQGLPYRSLEFLGDRPAVIYALHAARGPTLIWNGRADTVVNMPKTQDDFFEDLRRRVIAQRGSAEGVFEFGFIPATSHRPYFLTRPVVAWLERQLDFPNWTARTLEQPPETHISEWATQNGVAMDKLYATEEREGGTRAVGTDVPGVARETLSVFTAEEWQRHKSELTFDGWTERARAAR
ncbi:MAG: acetylxylan esterase [Opitutaceae bacterium]|nr:acetylxylan esterase [Opitutaceae bacterium]